MALPKRSAALCPRDDAADAIIQSQSPELVLSCLSHRVGGVADMVQLRAGLDEARASLSFPSTSLDCPTW